MEYHLEREIRLLTKPEREALYSWAIIETDAQGRQIGDDQIPWVWTLRFVATSCVLSDDLNTESQPQFFPEQDSSEEEFHVETKERQIIHAQLRPEPRRSLLATPPETSFSMFGTDRRIKNFYLEIRVLPSPAIGSQKSKEYCQAWGSVSYTSEVDFYKETTDDVLFFYLFVKPETFVRYAKIVSRGAVDEFFFSVGRVRGFYSEWSPSIHTDSVKVLTGGKEHKIDVPTGLRLEAPRLGQVGEAELYISRRLEFTERVHDSLSDNDMDDVETMQALPEVQIKAVADAQIAAKRISQNIQSIRKAAWAAVFLLAVICIDLLLKR